MYPVDIMQRPCFADSARCRHRHALILTASLSGLPPARQNGKLQKGPPNGPAGAARLAGAGVARRASRRRRRRQQGHHLYQELCPVQADVPRPLQGWPLRRVLPPGGRAIHTRLREPTGPHSVLPGEIRVIVSGRVAPPLQPSLPPTRPPLFRFSADMDPG